MLAAEWCRTDELDAWTRVVSGKIGIPSCGHTSGDVCEFRDVGDGGGQQGQKAAAHMTGDCGEGGGKR